MAVGHPGKSYADDFVILLICSLNEAKIIRNEIGVVLKERCNATLNIDKTLITNLHEGFDFLGANIKKLYNNGYLVHSKLGDHHFRRRVPLKLFITAPILKIINKLIETGHARRNHTGLLLAKGKTNLVLFDHYTIIKNYNSKIYGLLNFFSFAGNISSLHRIF